MYELISFKEQFKAIINLIGSKSGVGLLITIKDENFLICYDSISFIKCKIPDLKNKYYGIPINVKDLIKPLQKFGKKDSLMIQFEENKIDIKMQSKISKRNYTIQNIAHLNFDRIIIEQVEEIKPANLFMISSKNLFNEIENLAFKGKDKYAQKIIFEIDEFQNFFISDDARYKGHSKIEIILNKKFTTLKKPSFVKINWIHLKNVLEQMSNISDEVFISTDSGMPLKLFVKNNDYEILSVIAPIVEDVDTYYKK